MSSAAAETRRVRPTGAVTRGTTARRRLRRVDRWLLDRHPGLVRTADLLVVDLGFGAVPVTTTHLHALIRAANPNARVVGLEIDPVRVATAAAWTAPGLTFGRGGFELAGLRPHVVRAFNVLRQYDEHDVAGAWSLMTGALAPGGLVVEGTCDESGRLAAWVTLDAEGPRTLTLAVDPLRPPGAVAARLPKVLVHRNRPGEEVHRLLAELDGQWHRCASVAVFSPHQRLAAAVEGLAALGWPVLDGPARWRRGELTVAWSAVGPADSR
jgi:hypothetical protein